VEKRGRREFRGRADQVAAARSFVAAALSAGYGAARDIIRLLVSEAATNALLHSGSGRTGGTFTVEYTLTEARLRVEVHDDGAPGGPRRRIHHLESVTGRGLELFAALSSRWGVDGGPKGRTVWFELDADDVEVRR